MQSLKHWFKINELKGRVDELSENFNKEIGNIKMEKENIKRTNQKRRIH